MDILGICEGIGVLVVVFWLIAGFWKLLGW